VRRAAALGAALSVVAASPAAASPVILSAFFGLDDRLPPVAAVLCAPGPLLDGLPVVFRNEIDERTLWPSDFVVTSRSGARRIPVCATTAPANEESEDRTVLLIGEFGDDPQDPPVEVEIGRMLRDEDGRSMRFARAPVIPLAAGPELVYAEPAPPESDALTFPLLTPSLIGPFQRHTECPRDTVQRLRVTWDGGVEAPGPRNPGEAQRLAYTVTLAGGRTVKPVALADLGDMDNDHLLCLGTAARAVRVSAAPRLFVDPRGDLNPATSVRVVPD
jgi:hypothetical protein